jgi:hypothetical protein
VLSYLQFFTLKTCKIQLGPTLSPGGRKWQLIHPTVLNKKKSFCNIDPQGDITSRIELAKAWVHVIAENRVGQLPNDR